MSKLGCDYMGNDFGAIYLDSCCVNGQLYDLYNCDTYGNLVRPREFLPCPQCNHKAWVEDKRGDLIDQGFLAADHGQSREVPKFSGDISAEDVITFSAWWLEGYDEWRKIYGTVEDV